MSTRQNVVFLLGIFSKGVSLFFKAFLVIAVFFTVINLFLYLSDDHAPVISLQERINENSRKMEEMVHDPRINTPENALYIGFLKQTSCSIMGELCENGMSADLNYPNSMLGNFSKLIAMPFSNPPASGIYYVFNTLNNAGFVPKAYADTGIGFASLSSLQNIWKKFRDVSYILLVLILISIGFMIMFRMKLNPQTVISIENALPRIVITMILITFSFAIAGFLIDLMYISMALVMAILAPFIDGTTFSQLMDKYLQATPSDLLALFSGDTNFGIGDLTRIIWDLPNALLGLHNVIGRVIRLSGSVILVYLLHHNLNAISTWASKAADTTVGGEGGTQIGVPGLSFSGKIYAEFKGLISAFVGFASTKVGILFIIAVSMIFVIPFILGLIILLTLIKLIFRIILLLFTSYIKIIILVILSPFIIMLEAIPGKSSFTNWLRSLMVELVTFPVFISMFMLGVIIFQTAQEGRIFRLPFFYGFEPEAFSIVIGMAFIFLIPDYIYTVRKFLMPKPMELPEAGLGTFFGGAGAIGSGLKMGQSAAGIGNVFVPLGKAIEKVPFVGKNLMRSQLNWKLNKEGKDE